MGFKIHGGALHLVTAWIPWWLVAQTVKNLPAIWEIWV